MVRVLLHAATALLLTLAGCDRAQIPVHTPGEETTIRELINDRRAEASCPAVTADEQLTAAARRHAADMLKRNVRDHTGSDGSSAADRIDDAGYDAGRTGEILYWADGSGDAEEAVTAWMNSTGHRDIIRECRFTHLGVAVVQAEGEYIAVGDFAAARA